MPLRVEIPGREPLALRHLLLDVNGTLTRRGVLLDGVAERLAQVRDALEVHLLSADTLATVAAVARELGVAADTVADGAAKRATVDSLGRAHCVAVGNGANDAAMLGGAALGIAVLGPEGAAPATIAAADLVCATILDALDLLLEPRALAASLRP